MRELQAVLFDMDGLLINTERMNVECAREAAREWGFELDGEQMARTVMGLTRDRVLTAYAALLPKGVDAGAFYRFKVEKLMRRYAEEGIQPMKGARELLEWLNRQGVVCVLVTSTALERAEEILRGLGLWELLPARITGDMLTRSKPDPEPYLRAAALAGAEPGRCLVLEDSLNGLRAGRAAGCVVGMVPDTLPWGEECRPFCDHVFEDLTRVIDWLKEQ